jgi:hypothetical protein
VLAVRGGPALLDRLDQPEAAVGDDQQRAPSPRAIRSRPSSSQCSCDSRIPSITESSTRSPCSVKPQATSTPSLGPSGRTGRKMRRGTAPPAGCRRGRGAPAAQSARATRCRSAYAHGQPGSVKCVTSITAWMVAPSLQAEASEAHRAAAPGVTWAPRRGLSTAPADRTSTRDGAPHHDEASTRRGRTPRAVDDERSAKVSGAPSRRIRDRRPRSRHSTWRSTARKVAQRAVPVNAIAEARCAQRETPRARSGRARTGPRIGGSGAIPPAWPTASERLSSPRSKPCWWAPSAAIIRSRKSTIPIGASGVVFGYARYLISRGFFDPARSSWRSAPWWCSSGRCAARRAAAPGGDLLGGAFLGAVGGLVAAWVLARPRESAPASL